MSVKQDGTNVKPAGGRVTAEVNASSVVDSSRQQSIAIDCNRLQSAGSENYPSFETIRIAIMTTIWIHHVL